MSLIELLLLVCKRPLIKPRPHLELEGRIRSRLKALVEKQRNRYELAPTDALPDEDDSAPEIGTPEGDIDLRLDVEAGLERLKPAERQAVIGAAIFGLTDEEAAEEAGRSKDAVKKERQRAMERARKVIG